MKLKTLTQICTLLLLTSASYVSAEVADTHSAYKVTTYSLGTLLVDDGSRSLRMSNYEPLMITSTTSDVLQGEQTSLQPGSHPAPDSANGFAITAQFDATSRFTLKGAFGVTKSTAWNALDSNNDSSWEANLGLVYRFLDNLSYEIHFGYMETGDVFKERSSYSDVENIIMVSNKITMSF